MGNIMGISLPKQTHMIYISNTRKLNELQSENAELLS